MTNAVSLANLIKVPEIRNKVLVTLGLLLIYRIGFFIPLPGVNAEVMLSNVGSMDGVGRLFGMMNVLTGGSLGSATLFSLGVMPFSARSIDVSACISSATAASDVGRWPPTSAVRSSIASETGPESTKRTLQYLATLV